MWTCQKVRELIKSYQLVLLVGNGDQAAFHVIMVFKKGKSDVAVKVKCVKNSHLHGGKHVFFDHV